jgi:16S rRNA (uracil1498-N3)-methyltransferase
MRLTRIHVPAPLAANSELLLPEGAANHLVRVLRLREGAELLVFDGQGHEHHASIARIQGAAVTVLIKSALARNNESPLHITLVQGVSRGERMDWTLQKATELGVSRIVPVLTERSVVRLDDKQAGKKQQHWQQIVSSACEQSGRSVVPNVALPCTLRAFLTTPSPATARYVLAPDGADSLANQTSVDQTVELLIGPEGGLDDSEIQHALLTGFKSVRLGPRILRTETAAIVALSVLQARRGDLG